MFTNQQDHTRDYYFSIDFLFVSFNVTLEIYYPILLKVFPFKPTKMQQQQKKRENKKNETKITKF